MPLYEFRCSECGQVFEQLCRFNEEGDDKECPSCGHVGARRLVSVFSASGLDNGFMGIGKKWGNGGGSSGANSGSSSGKSDSGPGSESKAPASSCGPGCACAN